MLAHHPELTTAYDHFNGHVLFASTITPRQRELLVLRVAVVRGRRLRSGRSTRSWPGTPGSARTSVERVRSGPTPRAGRLFDAALLAAADELVHDARLSDGTWSTLSAELDTSELMDVVFTVGAYDLLAMAFSTFDVELDDDLVDGALPRAAPAGSGHRGESVSRRLDVTISVRAASHLVSCSPARVKCADWTWASRAAASGNASTR